MLVTRDFQEFGQVMRYRAWPTLVTPFSRLVILDKRWSDQHSKAVSH